MNLRKAKISDVPEIVRLVKLWADQGQMLARSQASIFNYLRSFQVVEENGQIIGVGSLSIIWGDLAEVRTLAIHPDHIGKGLGSTIVHSLLQEAKELEIPKVFTLTYKPDFFKKMGFQSVDKQELPHKVWTDCINCPKFPDCDEHALSIAIAIE